VQSSAASLPVLSAVVTGATAELSVISTDAPPAVNWAVNVTDKNVGAAVSGATVGAAVVGAAVGTSVGAAVVGAGVVGACVGT
jgi:hypothetical protein